MRNHKKWFASMKKHKLLLVSKKKLARVEFGQHQP